MAKKELGRKPFLFPMPVVLVGANVKGKPNYLTAAWVNIVNYDPPMIMAALNKVRYTSIGIKENQTFSVNVPSADMVKITDYCGLFSGHKTDKSLLFESFYGKLKTAPLIAECPVNLECRLIQTVELKTHEVFIGEIIETYAEENFLSNGAPDLKKINPFVFSISGDSYYQLGELLARAHHVGKDYQK